MTWNNLSLFLEHRLNYFWETIISFLDASTCLIFRYQCGVLLSFVSLVLEKLPHTPCLGYTSLFIDAIFQICTDRRFRPVSHFTKMKFYENVTSKRYRRHSVPGIFFRFTLQLFPQDKWYGYASTLLILGYFTLEFFLIIFASLWLNCLLHVLYNLWTLVSLHNIWPFYRYIQTSRLAKKETYALIFQPSMQAMAVCYQHRLLRNPKFALKLC